jgi:hypothetical protein
MVTYGRTVAVALDHFPSACLPNVVAGDGLWFLRWRGGDLSVLEHVASEVTSEMSCLYLLYARRSASEAQQTQARRCELVA